MNYQQCAAPVSRRNIALLAALALFVLGSPSRADAAPLPAPQNVNVTPGPGSLEVSWDAVSGANSYEISYRIAAVTTAQVPPTVSGPQIVGGAGTSIANFPWQVALLYALEPDSFFAQFCGGSLVAPEWVVTAAHCVEGLTEDDIEVGYGESHLTDMGTSDRISVEDIVVHNSWTGNFVSPGDIAMLKLSQPVPGGQVIRVPSAAEVTGNGETVWASGWGNTMPFAPGSGYANLLQAVELEVLAGPSDPV
ncbi:MAG: serine protease, partial [Acidimicrobiia bacterium]|nr:serine protease [Acidimicrobiia bacterium]